MAFYDNAERIRRRETRLFAVGRNCIQYFAMRTAAIADRNLDSRNTLE